MDRIVLDTEKRIISFYQVYQNENVVSAVLAQSFNSFLKGSYTVSRQTGYEVR